MIKIKQVVELAHVARAITEQFAVDNNTIGDVETLTCYCAIGSFILSEVGRRREIPIDICEGNFGEINFWRNQQLQQRDQLSPTFRKEEVKINHCWNAVNVNNKRYIVDITASQFDYEEKVYVSYKRDEFREKYLEISRNMKTRKSLKEDWKKHQSPYLWKNYIFKMIDEILKD